MTTTATRNNAITASSLQNVRDEYRGLGVDVAHLNNNVKDILQASGLDWRVGQAKIGMVGRTETRMIDGHVANVRSDTGAFLSLSTTDYKPHHNAELLGMMARFADKAEMTITRVGHFAGGTRIWASAESPRLTGELALGDTVKVQALLRSGHEPGTATTARARALRLSCLNGATISEAAGMVRFVHSSKLTNGRVARVAEFVDATSKGFLRYQEAMASLYATPSNGFIDRLLLLELVQPELVQLVHDRMHRVSNTRPASSTPGLVSLDAIVREHADRQESQSVVRNLIAVEGNRRAKLLDAVLDRQQGAQYSRGTLAHSVNAVTAYQTHLSGRTPEGGVESSMFSVSQDMGSQALANATQWAAAIREVAGR